jgi:probable HAF family extracellular repeat protein
MRTCGSLALFAAALCSSALSSAAPPTTYRLTEFGGDDSSSKFTTVNGVNDAGDGSVTVFSTGTAQAFLWRAGQLIPLSGLDSVCGAGAARSAGSINNRGQILVELNSPDGSCNKSVIWQGGRVVQVIGPPPPGYAFVTGGFLNDFDHVVGTASGIDSSVQTEFVWVDGRFTLLPVLPGGATGGPGGAEAGGINELGVVVGTSGSTDGQRAVLWRNGAITNLGVCPGFDNSGASGINNLDEIVGGCETSTFAPFIWRNGRLTVLPIPATGPQSALAGGINDFDQIVGASEPTGGELGDAGAALLWQGGAVYDLNTLVAPRDPLKPYIKLLQSGHITNTGIILANGEDSRVPNNQSIQFILTPAH